MEKTYLDLKTDRLRKFFIAKDRLHEIKAELEEFLNLEQQMNSLTFAKKVLFSQEVKSNNNVEGYVEDIDLIEQVISKAATIKDSSKRQRVLNLCNAYTFILNTKEMNKEVLKELYSILSRNLLHPLDADDMGEYYRNGAVVITNRMDLEHAAEGMPADELEEFMNTFFDYLNNGESFDDATDYYIKSQIMHFYFVYVHPYFDVNGRTSRTVAMWYLLKNEAYPYIIFNRGINFNRSRYDEAITDVRKYFDLTFFAKYMMETVKVELEKEYIMQQVASQVRTRFTANDYQMLLYFLSVRDLKTVCSLSTMYNHFNDNKKIKDIYETMILPLIDNGVLQVKRTTGKNMFGNFPNQVLGINPSMFDNDPVKIKRLVLENPKVK